MSEKISWKVHGVEFSVIAGGFANLKLDLFSNKKSKSYDEIVKELEKFSDGIVIEIYHDGEVEDEQ